MAEDSRIRIIIDDLREVKRDVKLLLGKESERKGAMNAYMLVAGFISAAISILFHWMMGKG